MGGVKETKLESVGECEAYQFMNFEFRSAMGTLLNSSFFSTDEAWRLGKLWNDVNREINRIQKEYFEEVKARDLAEKDKLGNILYEGDQPKILEEKKEEWKKLQEELQHRTFKFKVYKFPFSSVNKLGEGQKLTPLQLQSICWILYGLPKELS